MPNTSAAAPDLGRIRADVSSMLDQGATEQEVDTYLASESVTPQDLNGHMSPEDERAYTALAADPQATAADLQAFVRQRGYNVTDGVAAAFTANRSASVPNQRGETRLAAGRGQPLKRKLSVGNGPIADASAR